ncbi:hypothetical protein HBA55_34410 [Pseudomaricurvus alkylphenolicus]|uniref:hypothetical protein n=1 Tax=Pseudomaricurvus alkylphenolicus TaxID=1306991 RepID=UPI001420896F|nr:hypothetical protein [Pseudomaricurvus alkylphenolicus]NIB44724.1 hypothetical protein [Pseudomaricurvus alkylphenolicus]
MQIAGSNVAVNSPIEIGGGWMGGAQDFLSGMMDAYFQFENGQLGLELQRAQIQQQRTQDAISVEQQVQQNQQQRQQQNDNQGGDMAKYAVLGLGGIALLLLLRK